MFPLFAKGGYMAIQPFFRGENLLYSHFYAYPDKGGNMAMGENGSITPTCIPQKGEQKNIYYFSVTLFFSRFNYQKTL
jgi:hypothetical protein